MTDQQAELLRLITNYLFVDPRSRSLKSSVPLGFTGQGIDWYAATIPEGWLACDGSLLKRDEYPELFLVIGTTWNIGGETSAQFRLPDRRRVVAVGRDAAVTAYDTVGKSGGSSQITLSLGNMPAHSHGMGTYDGSWMANTGITTGGGPQAVTIGTGSAGVYRMVTDSRGSGTPIDYAPPYKVINHIIKT